MAPPQFSLLPPTASTVSALSNPSKRKRLNPSSPHRQLSIHPSAMAASAPHPPPMDLVSPASPMGLRLSSDNNKSATVFLSHVRRTFARYPVDYTGELVRLLDDIATFTCATSASVAERSHNLVYGAVGSGLEISASSIIHKLYRVLAHDGYCCIVLAKGFDQPLTFDDSVLHGNYVVCVSPLDIDPLASDDNPVAGMLFSVYKRKSSTSLPGRGMDLRQNLSDQVAAGYASFSSATTLHYTMGHGVYSFVMHPVALQYFLQPPMRLTIPENPTIVYADRKLLKSPHPISAPLAKHVDKLSCSMFTSGCLVGDLHQMMQTGGVVVHTDVHLMCEAAPIAYIVEQSGGVATDHTGARILDMAVTDDFNHNITIVLGTPESHRNLHLSPEEPATSSNPANGAH